MNIETKTEMLKRDETITILEAYSLFLEQHGYMDTDWRAEPPFAIDEFLKLQAKNKPKPQTWGEKYPCPKCKSTNITHCMTESGCNDCDYNSENE